MNKNSEVAYPGAWLSLTVDRLRWGSRSPYLTTFLPLWLAYTEDAFEGLERLGWPPIPLDDDSRVLCTSQTGRFK